MCEFTFDLKKKPKENFEDCASSFENATAHRWDTVHRRESRQLFVYEVVIIWHSVLFLYCLFLMFQLYQNVNSFYQMKGWRNKDEFQEPFNLLPEHPTVFLYFIIGQKIKIC